MALKIDNAIVNKIVQVTGDLPAKIGRASCRERVFRTV